MSYWYEYQEVVITMCMKNKFVVCWYEESCLVMYQEWVVKMCIDNKSVIIVSTVSCKEILRASYAICEAKLR